MNSWKIYNPKEAISERPEEEDNETDREQSSEKEKDNTRKTKLDKILDFRKDNKDSYEFLTKNGKSFNRSNSNSIVKNKIITADNFKPYDNNNNIDDEFKDVDLEFDLKSNKIYEGNEKDPNKLSSLDDTNEKEANLTKVKEDKKEANPIQCEEEKFITNICTNMSEKIIYYLDAWKFFLSLEYEKEKKKIVTEDFSKYNCLKKFYLKCTSKLELNKNLLEEREIIFSIAKTDLDHNQECHMRILKSIYFNLTDTSCDKFDWTLIGFQGDDPKTDLRAVGMFGLLQILYFTEKFKDFSKEMFNHSLDKLHHFPLVCLYLNFTMISIEALREGDLIDLCNKRKSVITTLNEFFTGCVFYFFFQYKSEEKSIVDIGRMIQLMNPYMKENVSHIMSIHRDELNKVLEKANISLNGHN